MGKFDTPKKLVDRARAELPGIEKAYQESLNKHLIDDDLKITIKIVFDNLRSALDYSARVVYTAAGSPGGPDAKLYFPIAKKADKLENFSGTLGRSIPKLGQTRSDLVTIFESFQPFSNPANVWLSDFATLANENKHEDLTPQVRREQNQMNIKSGGASISIGHGASISIGHGASVQFGGTTIHSGQTFDAKTVPQMTGPASVERITWVSFVFTTTGNEVLTLLRQAVNGVDSIITTLEAKT